MMNKRHLCHKEKPQGRIGLRSGFSLLLCVVMALSICALPALGAETEEYPQLQEQPLVQEEYQDGSQDAFQADLEDEMEPENEIQRDTFTLTFRMGIFGTEILTVPAGEYPSPVPAIPELSGASVLGWFNAAGEQVSPGSLPVWEDAVYTARWGREVSVLLNTDDHIAYVKGDGNGLFRPESSVTRAEAAQMFYALLREKDWEPRSFSDVEEGQWYQKAVETMAGLGVLQGYTDGTFQPQKPITRAEFVVMAVACDTLTKPSEGSISFTDVEEDYWGRNVIACAVEKGWISGFGDGSFRPESNITRAQAVAILNRMLGRQPDAQVVERQDVKSFYDVFSDSWSYVQIMEASVEHSYAWEDGKEVWDEYEKAVPIAGGWIKSGSVRYYVDPETGKVLRGQHIIDGKTYLLDNVTGEAVTGFRMDGAWRRYYQDGLRVEDISSLGLVSGPYLIKVYKNSNYLIIFAKDANGQYNTPVKAMRVSCGYGTPVGTFYTPCRYRWLKMVGSTWAQWCTQIQGSYLFHSVPNWTKSNMNLEVDEYNHLGETRSMGCIRLCCQDAKWIFDNCVLGTQVVITTSEDSGPLSKPGGIQIPSWHTWDPTDPTAYWRCQENGCH